MGSVFAFLSWGELVSIELLKPGRQVSSGSGRARTIWYSAMPESAYPATWCFSVGRVYREGAEVAKGRRDWDFEF